MELISKVNIIDLASRDGYKGNVSYNLSNAFIAYSL